MTLRPDGEGAEPNQIDQRGDVSSVSNRRDILLAAAGGFAFAANGLFLPGDESASALADDASGVAIERNRRKRRRRRHRGAPGGAFFKASALTFGNKTKDQILHCTFCYRVKTGLDDYTLPVYNFTRDIQPGEYFRYDPTNPRSY